MKRLVGVLVLALAVMAAVAQEQQPLNNDAIVKMVKSGLGENLIVVENAKRAGRNLSFLENLKVELPLTILATRAGAAISDSL